MSKNIMAVPRKRPITEIITKFLSKESRVELPSDCCILAASDARQFVGFQLLYTSIILGYNVQIVFVDLGLTGQQREWCLAQPNLLLLNKDFYYPFGTDRVGWQTWNKPFYMANTPYKKVLWVDVDVIVNQGLEDVLKVLESQPVINPDRNPSCRNTLWQLLPVNGLVQELPPFINAGVVGLDFTRDIDCQLHKEWCWAIQQASENAKVEDAMIYYDQSALKWATYRCGASKYILNHYRYDLIVGAKPMSLHELLQHCKKRPENLIHYAGKTKPWQDWGYLLDLNIDHVSLSDKTQMNADRAREFANEATVYVLHDQQSMLDKVEERNFIHKVNLKALPVEEFQTAEFGENRFFISREWETTTTDYIGVASARWSRKFPNVLRPEQLYRLDQLSPEKVYGAEVETDWLNITSRQHPGIERYILDLSQKMNCPDTKARTVSGNNFVCHIDTFRKFMLFWEEAFQYLYDRYGFDLDFEYQGFAIRPAHLYSRITSLYFANRPDLQVLPIPLSSPGRDPDMLDESAAVENNIVAN